MCFQHFILHSCCFTSSLHFPYAFLNLLQRCTFWCRGRMNAVWIHCTILGIQSSFFLLGKLPFFLQSDFLSTFVAVPENEEQN
jgi:hypothetical protein